MRRVSPGKPKKTPLRVGQVFLLASEAAASGSGGHASFASVHDSAPLSETPNNPSQTVPMDQVHDSLNKAQKKLSRVFSYALTLLMATALFFSTKLAYAYIAKKN